MTANHTGILAEALHLASRLGGKTRERGVAHVAVAAAKWVAGPVLAPIYQRTRRGREFSFRGQSFPYFWHRYNATWRNERAIEVPIAWDAIQKARGKRILEVGNVLSHYFEFEHDTLDKYEKVPGVINQDVDDFRPAAPYDLIVSISTLEHVGWDETPKDASKIPRVIDAMRSWLAPGGTLLVTVPFGYNDFLDDHFRTGAVRFSDQRYLKRESADNRWTETSWENIATAKYGVPFAESSGHMVIGSEQARTT